jgi:hypothetical protein
VCVEVLIDCHKVVDFKFVSIEEVFIDFLCAFTIERLGKKKSVDEKFQFRKYCKFVFFLMQAVPLPGRSVGRMACNLETLFQHARSTRDR